MYSFCAVGPRSETLVKGSVFQRSSQESQMRTLADTEVTKDTSLKWYKGSYASLQCTVDPSD